MAGVTDLEPITLSDPVKTYVSRVVVEQDDDRWGALCPALEHLGAATRGDTREEALKHINEVVQLVLAELVEDGRPVPPDVQVSEEPLIAITV